MEVFSILALFTSTSALIWALFTTTESLMKPDMRSHIAHWLRKGGSFNQLDFLPSLLLGVFYNLFGHKHLSGKCFVRSSIVSVYAVGFMILVVLSLLPIGTDIRVQNLLLVVTGLGGGAVAIPILLFLSGTWMNLVPDYIALLKTRFVLGRMVVTHSVSGILLLLFLDTVLTIIIGGLAVFSVILSTVVIFQPESEFLETAGYSFLNATKLFANLGSISYVSGSVIGIFFYSTFVTSAWVWLYLCSLILARMVGFLNVRMRDIISLHNVEEHPLKSLGFLLVILNSIVCLIVLSIKMA